MKHKKPKIGTIVEIIKSGNRFNAWDKDGNKLENIEEQLLSNIMLSQPEPYMYCLTNNFVDNKYCYDGSFVFTTKPTTL